jgi:hypothetical protein
LAASERKIEGCRKEAAEASASGAEMEGGRQGTDGEASFKIASVLIFRLHKKE